MTTILIAGATGLVGRELIREALAAGAAVQALVRRTGAAAPGVRQIVVDFAALPALPSAELAACALGTTIKTAGSQAAFRAIDFDAVVAFAGAARAAGVTRFAVVSALGANAQSSNFYSRVKGEMEAALASLAFEQLVIAQPSLLAGDRESLGQPSRLGEKLALALSAPLAPLIPLAWRPIQASTVARALWRSLSGTQTGVQVLVSKELQRLGA